MEKKWRCTMKTFDSNAGRTPSGRAARVLATGVLWTAGALLAVALPTSAFAQTTATCGPEVKEEAANAITALAGLDDATRLGREKELYSKYSYCGQDAALAPASFFDAARQCGAAVSNLGSIFFEEMSCAGYDPQRRQFAAPIKIKQIVGFGGNPLPGSREHVLHCVADPAGVLRPVGRDSVHLSNAPGKTPTWQFAVIANANDNLGLVQPMSGDSRRARSILSWGFTPTGCDFTPIWGNALNYRIRLDQ